MPLASHRCYIQFVTSKGSRIADINCYIWFSMFDTASVFLVAILLSAQAVDGLGLLYGGGSNNIVHTSGRWPEVRVVLLCCLTHIIEKASRLIGSRAHHDT